MQKTFLPHPRKTPTTVLAKEMMADFSQRPVNMPDITNAGFRILGHLYNLGLSNHHTRGYRKRGATPAELGTHWRALEKLIEAHLLLDKKKYVSLTPQGHRWYEVEYYVRLYRQQKKAGLPIDLEKGELKL